MWQQINNQVVTLLTSPPYNMKVLGEYLRDGVCPSCGKKTLWTWANSPGLIQCNRTNHCSYEATGKDLFPELFENLNKKYQATPDNPTATADAYLALVRGFDVNQLKGWYEQGKYWHPHGNKGTATVRFYLDDAKTLMWERLIDDVTITHDDGDQETRNKNFKGSFKGYWWQPPTLTITSKSTVWLCEGILDCIALTLNDINAVAIMSAGTFPSESIKPYLNKGITWVLALDNDKTGLEKTHKHAKKLREMGEIVSAAFSSQSETKLDWNDLHKRKALTVDDVIQYRYYGKLELARSYMEKARIMFLHDNSKSFFVFSHKHCMYSFKIDMAEYKNAEKIAHDNDPTTAAQVAFDHASEIKQIATFNMDFLYFQQPDTGEEGQYFFRFNFSNHAPEIQLPFPGKNLSVASDFKKSAMNKTPGAQFTGSNKDLDYLYREWTAHIPKIVHTIDFIGYDQASNAYIFNDYAVQNSKIIPLNKQSFFQLKDRGVKTMVDIKQRLTDQPNKINWLPDYITAFSIKGVVALSWWLGCLYAEQIRAEHRSYPFFGVVGEANSGKTDMVDFLWKLYGKDGESFNPNSSTLPGRTRKMSEVSNLPVVFNETDNEQSAKDAHRKTFNWDETKDLYNGEFGRVTGVKTGDNSTRKPLFKGGLMYVQNIPVKASDAILSRIVHLQFDCTHHSLQGKYASDRLNNLTIDELCGFLLPCITKADAVLALFNKQHKHHQQTLQQLPELKMQRIIHNHAQLMALCDCLKIVLDIDDKTIRDAQELLSYMAIERQKVVNDDDELVQQFWAIFDYLDSQSIVGGNEQRHIMNHCARPEDEIWINLEHFRQASQYKNQELLDTIELKRRLQTSRKRPFVGHGHAYSALEKRTIYVWKFKRSASE